MSSNEQCKCGGAYQVVRIPEYDLTSVVGLPCILRRPRVRRCQACGHVLIPGTLVTRAMRKLWMSILEPGHVIDAQEVRYLREQLLLSQEQLAEALDLRVSTVQAWESGQPIQVDPSPALRLLCQRQPAWFIRTKPPQVEIPWQVSPPNPRRPQPESSPEDVTGEAEYLDDGPGDGDLSDKPAKRKVI